MKNIYTPEFSEALEEFAEAGRTFLESLPEFGHRGWCVEFELTCDYDGRVRVQDNRGETMFSVKAERRKTEEEKRPARVSLK